MLVQIIPPKCVDICTSDPRVRATPVNAILITRVTNAIIQPIRIYITFASSMIPRYFLVFSWRSYENNVINTIARNAAINHPAAPHTAEKAVYVTVLFSVRAQGNMSPRIPTTPPARTSFNQKDDCQKNLHSLSQWRIKKIWWIPRRERKGV